MYVDALLEFCDDQAVTAAAGSTSTIDTNVAGGIDLGTGEPLYIVCMVTTVLSDGGSNTGTAVALEGDSTETFTPDGTDTLFTFAKDAALGTVKIARLSPDMAALAFRYLRLKFTPAGASLTGGTFSAFITKDIQRYRAYADAITIS